MITRNEYFTNLGPLTNYLEALQQVTERPSEAAIVDLMTTDKILTDRAVLFPCQKLIHDEGYRTFGFEACTVSDGVEGLARLALDGPGSPESRGRQASDRASEQNRRATARAALITLGGKLAVSGAFFERQIGPAYEAIRGSIDAIGKQDADFTAFGLRRIRDDLFENYVDTRRPLLPYQNPISNGEARRNITAAWEVIGRPYGKFTKLVAILEA